MSADALPEPPRFPAGEPASRRRGGRPAGLTREAIVEKAMAIVDHEGLDALTMRTLAHALGTGAASLYAHFKSKDDIVESLVDKVIGEMDFVSDRPDPARWTEQLKSAARSMLAVYHRHGDIARATFARIPMGENAVRGADWMLGVMRAGGISDTVAALAMDLLSLYIGAIAYEDSIYAGKGVTPEQIAAFVEQLQGFFASLPPERFPNVTRLAGPLTAGDDAARFEFGLEVLVRGLIAVSDAAQ
jgi:AcrR family transcriptional regulator